MSVEVDYGQWGTLTLAAGQDAWYWYTWGFDENHWARMDASPDNWPASIWIVEQWAEKDLNGVTKRWVHWKNNGSTPVSFRPRVIQAPSRW
ncbi:MAG TPA: hypothetical protein VN282_28340 [Pyrinomonadaceae bacterium]|nr:hypothetical protein [Pyrinomonadaceae bacterium]